VLHGEWIAGSGAARCGQSPPHRRFASLPRLALSKIPDLNPPRSVFRSNGGILHVSRSLWLIVALRAPSVKSTRGSAESFEKNRNLLQARNFSALSGCGFNPMRRGADPVITTVRCGAIQHPFG